MNWLQVFAILISSWGVFCEERYLDNEVFRADSISFVAGLLPGFGKDQTFLKNFNFSKPSISEKCSAAFQIFVKSMESPLKDENFWAMKMVDSNAKLPSGLLQGGYPMFGSFDQCLAIDAEPSSWASMTNIPQLNESIRGQYCSMRIQMPTPEKADSSNSTGSGDYTALGNMIQVTGAGPTVTAKLGNLVMMSFMFLRVDLCLPAVCSVDDINNALELPFLKQVIKIGISECQKEEPVTLATSQIIAIVCFSVLAFFLVVGTLTDLILRMKKHFFDKDEEESTNYSSIVNVLLAFSAYTNGLKILNTKTTADNLTAVNGIRFLSMSWVILGHCYVYVSMAVLGNIFIIKDFTQNFALQAVFNGFLSVDTFFFLSGLLLTYGTIRELKKRNRISLAFFGYYYFHRVWRLTPAIIFTILLVFLLPLMGSGPMWQQSFAGDYNNCEKNWWVTLLYMQGFVNKGFMCMGHSWYLSNDMHFYIVAPVILIALYKFEKLGLVINGLFLLMSTITPAVLGYLRNYPPTILFGAIGDFAGILDFMQETYQTPYCRMGPFCIGVYVGYFLVCKKEVKINKIVQVVLWCLSVACNMSVLYGVYDWNKSGPREKWNWEANLYLGVHRTAWALGVGWMTFACATNHGGIVNRILSWKPFIPLGRMSFMAYLLHPYVQFAYQGLLRERIIYTHYLYTVLYLGFMVMSYAAAFAGCLAVEAPFLALEKLMFKKTTKKSSEIIIQPSLNNKMTELNELPAAGYDNEAFSNGKFISRSEKF